MCLERNRECNRLLVDYGESLRKLHYRLKTEKNKLTKMACKTLKTDCWCCVVVECLLLGMTPSD